MDNQEKTCIVMRFVILWIVCFGIFACKNSSYSTDDIYGRWEVNNAIRNGKQTETLNGAFFSFEENNTMRTNMMGSESTNTFMLDGSSDQIIQEGPEGLTFKILELSNDNLILSTTIRNVPFILNLSSTSDTLDSE